MANIELDGPNKKIKVDSGDLTLDVPGDIVLDADGGDVVFADGGTNLLKVTNSSSDVVLQPQVDTKDIVFKQYDGTVVATVEDNATFNIPASKLAIGGTAVTSTAAELNILDGVTSTTAELNIMDGVTSTTAELNILDGVTSTASELNLLDGGTSVGSSITLADADGLVVNDGGTMKTIPASDVKTYTGGSNFVRTGNVESTTVALQGFMSSSYYLYTIYASIINTATDNTFINMRFLNSSNSVVTANLNNSFIYTIGDGSTDYDVLSQDTASSNTNRLSVGDDINETYNYVINITNHQGNNIFYNFTATTEDWTNGKSQSIKGGGKFYSDGTNITGVDFITNAGTAVSGKVAAFAIKSS